MLLIGWIKEFLSQNEIRIIELSARGLEVGVLMGDKSNYGLRNSPS